MWGKRMEGWGGGGEEKGLGLQHAPEMLHKSIKTTLFVQHMTRRYQNNIQLY